MGYVSYTETSTVRTDWTIDGSNKEFDLSFTPASWSVFAFVNRVHAKINLVTDNVVFLNTAPYTDDQVDFQYAVSDVGYPEYPLDYTEESSDGTLTGSVNGVNAAFTLSETPDAWNVYAFINSVFVPSTVSGAVVTLGIVPATGDLVTIRYTYNGDFPAYYKCGYFGIEEPRRMKFFRNCQLVTNGSGFQLKHYMVDYENYFLQNPQEIAFAAPVRLRSKVNKKAVLHQVYIRFPEGNAPADVLQLSDSYFRLSVRR